MSDFRTPARRFVPLALAESVSEVGGQPTCSIRQAPCARRRELRLPALRRVHRPRARLLEQTLRSPVELACLPGRARCGPVDESLGPAELPRHTLRNRLAGARR